MLDEAIKLLSESQNRDGGWGSVSRKQSNTESTALALMALRSIKNSQHNHDLRRAEEWLINSQNADGSWPYGAGAKAASWSTALAVIALHDCSVEPERLVRSGNWILAQAGSKPG